MPPSISVSSLGHCPNRTWVFDDRVAAVFDDMLARSIPQIDTMRGLVNQIAVPHAQPGTDIVDLGCARGEAMASLLEALGAAHRYVGVEASEPMAKACVARFAPFIERGVVEIVRADLRDSYPDVQASVTLAVLTLQFVPIEHRLRVLATAFERTVSGGVFILVEKLLGSDAKTNDLFVRLYYEHKRRMGYTQEEIDRKRLALEGVLVPVTAEWNEQLLRGAGFRQVECFWRHLCFAGWVGVKP